MFSTSLLQSSVGGFGPETSGSSTAADGKSAFAIPQGLRHENTSRAKLHILRSGSSLNARGSS